LKISVKATTAATRIPKPTMAARPRPLVACPRMPSRASTMIGIPSLANTFHTPDTMIDSVTEGRSKPQERFWA
jgi:hypothetical protein